MLHRFFAGCAVGAACIVSLGSFAGAATPSPAPSNSALPEIARVLTSDRRLEPIDRTSRPTFVVTRAQFDAVGARTVTDALQLVPGIPTLRDYYGFGAIANYGIRGANSQQTLVLLDGMPIAGASSGTIDLGTYPLTGIDRIEIVESGSSTLYGTSAAGGVINLISTPLRGIDIALADGSYADRNARVGLGDGRLSATFERRVATDAFAYPAFNYRTQRFPPGVRTDAWAQASAFRASAAEPLGGPYHFRADIGLDAVGGGAPGRLDFPTPFASERVARNAFDVEIQRNGARSLLSLAATAARQGLVFSDSDPFDCGGESDTYDGRVQLSLKDVISSERGALVAGVDLARESASFAFCPAFAPPNGFSAAESQAAAYLQEQYQLAPEAQLIAGLRGENDAPHGSVLAPSLGATFRFGALRIAGNVAESFRVPSLTDLYYPGFSNPNLVPEKARNADVTFALPQLGGGASLGWFARDGTNFIALDRNFRPQNIGRASVAGLMLTAKSPPFGGTVVEAGVTDVYRALDLVKMTRLPRNPVFQAAVGLTHPFGNANLAYGVHASVVGSTFAPADTPFGSGGNLYDAYSTVDAYLRIKLERNAIVSLRVRNLGDQRYAPIAGYPALGRTFQVELSNVPGAR
jgi:vitamin B12 transporter